MVDPIPERTAARALGVVLVGGLLAQLLFFGQGFGLNVTLWIGFVLVTAFVLRRSDARMDRWDLWLPPTALFFASFVAIRDDVMLYLFDMLAAGMLALASVVAIGGQPVTRNGWRQVTRLAAVASLLVWLGAPQLAPGVRVVGRTLPRDGTSTPRRLFRGLLLAIPLLVVFSVLFAAADAVFASYLGRIVSFDLGQDVAPRVVIAFCAGWLLAGTIVCAWLARRTTDEASATREHSIWRLGSYEVAVVLIALVAMFVLFVLLQAATLLGGVDTMLETGMTYAEYARRGFFELIFAAGLTIGVIVVLARLVEARDRTFRLLAAVLAALTGVVLVSALVRMGLYQAAYGWTELRFYALAAIAWLAVGLLATIVLVAWDRAGEIPRVMVAAGLVIALACHIVGPNSFVTGRNVERALNPSLVADGGWSGLDSGYLELLGSDSVGVLLANVDRLPVDQRAGVRSVLRQQADRLALREGTGWPAWNVSRHLALEALRREGY